jgi:hypothetical protein
MTEKKKDSEDGEALVLFNKGTSTLPAAVQRAIEKHGLKVRPKAGVEPSWKPTKPGEYVVGEVLAIRSGVGEFGGTVLVINAPEGPCSVWLGADLKVKMGNNVKVGEVYCIQYMGKLKKTENPKLKNDMHQFQVSEILPE